MNPSFIVIIIFPQLTETCLICPCFISHFCFLFAISVTLMGSITSCLKSESPANLCLSTWTLNPSMLPACPDAFFPSQYEQVFSIQPCWLRASSRKLSLDPLSWKLCVPPLKSYSTFFLPLARTTLIVCYNTELCLFATMPSPLSICVSMSPPPKEVDPEAWLYYMIPSSWP